MARKTLTLDNIGDIDAGALRIALNQALKQATQDLADRPALEKKRTVALVIELKPKLDKHSQSPTLEEADVTWTVKASTPAIGSTGIMMKPQSDGQLVFNSEIDTHPDQETFDDEVDRRRGRRGDGGKLPS